MNKNDISLLVHYNFWANGRILSACEQLTPEAFQKPITPDPSWASLRGILVHTLDTEHGWRTAMQSQPDTILNAADFENVAALKARWDIEQTAWLAYVASLTDETLRQTYGENAQNKLNVWQTIMHVVTHGIQHRSEAAVILTGYGYSPGELGLDVFLQWRT